MKKLLILIGIFCALKTNAQDYLITFTGTGASTAVSSVNVENQSTGKSLIISGSDILHLTTITTGFNSTQNDLLSKIKIYPNPMTDYSTVHIYPPVKGDAVITVVDITGKTIARIQSYLENYRQDFKLSGLKNGFYLINVTGYNYHFSGKLLCNGKSNGAISIEKVNNVIQTVDEKASKTDSKGVQATVDMEYTSGDRLKFTGISGNYSTVISDIPESDKTITFTFIACSDGDDNNYPVVEIGTQVWMAVNLKTTKYSDGTNITYGKDSWPIIGTEGFCFYRFSESHKDWGGYYNWYAVDVASNGNKNVCPTGWHVPSYVDWVTMKNYLIANGYNWDGTTSGNKIAKSLTSEGWYYNGGEGLAGGWDHPAYRNKTGFSANSYNFVFKPPDWDDLKSGYWWSATGFNTSSAIYTQIAYVSAGLSTDSYESKNYGINVRCLKGEVQLLPVLATSAISSIKSNQASSGGNITSDGGTNITTRGVCWSTSSNPTIEDKKTINGIGTGEFTSSIYGLVPGTTYYVRAYAINGVGTAYGNQVSFSTKIADVDGNIYNIVTIGTQIWMAENLKTTKYNDGTAIPLVTDNAAWMALTTPGFCWYNNDAIANKDTYGAMYNWYTVNSADNGGKNVCPTDYHVPTDVEWTTLTDYLTENGFGYQGSGSDIAKSLAAVSGWSASAIVGTIGNNQASNNSSGFTALPGGARDYDGTFGNISQLGTLLNYGGWWSVLEFNAGSVWSRSLYFNDIVVHRANDSKRDGLSVRCLKDN